LGSFLIEKVFKFKLHTPIYECMQISSKAGRREREYLTSDEVEKLLSAARGTRNPQRDYAIVLLMYRHGLRVSELCGLKLSDVNLELGELYVNRLKGSDGGPHPLYNGEGAAIRAWLGVRSSFGVPEGVDTLFVSERRQRLSRFTINVMIEKLALAASLGTLDIHPHSLRHSCGYSLVNRGTDIRVIQSYLGHRSISSTVRYTKLNHKQFAKLF
jgi:type 1 fimbriae regulatory protein FimB